MLPTVIYERLLTKSYEVVNRYPSLAAGGDAHKLSSVARRIRVKPVARRKYAIAKENCKAVRREIV